ncbi:MAG: hypothetical protein IPP51_01485 [Bacteroidetes bacterium]|nr:hypothetical protein [Bacteroidota bacterium]
MKKILPLLLCIAFFASCTTDKKYEYEVNPVNVSQNDGDKTTAKTTTEFISIAYSDLYGTSISQTKLVNLSVAYASFGDLKVIEERIVRNFLNDPVVIIPAQPSVNGDTSAFVKNCYRKFFNRDPNEFETYHWKELIRTNSSVTPATIYFAMMTSDEYRFY